MPHFTAPEVLALHQLIIAKKGSAHGVAQRQIKETLRLFIIDAFRIGSCIRIIQEKTRIGKKAAHRGKRDLLHPQDMRIGYQLFLQIYDPGK